MNWKRSLMAVIVVLPVLALFRFGLSRDPRIVPSPLPGREAPDFTLQRMDPAQGAPEEVAADEMAVRLAAHRGEVVVLNFWASWCLACRDEHSALSEVAARYRGKGVVFYGVLYNDQAEKARRWIEEMGGQSYSTLLDPGSRTAIDYGLYGVPETFFIDPEGKVAYKQIGPVTRDLLIRKLEELRVQPAEGAE